MEDREISEALSKIGEFAMLYRSLLNLYRVMSHIRHIGQLDEPLLMAAPINTKTFNKAVLSTTLLNHISKIVIPDFSDDGVSPERVCR